MKILIVVNAYVRNESQISKAQRLEEELVKLGCEVEIAKNFGLAEIINGNIESTFVGKCVFLDKDKAAAELLERAGCRLYNSARAMELCDDKMLTHAALAGHGINMPRTVYAPLCYYPDAELPAKFLNEVAQNFGFPLVAKLCFGSLGSGVFLIKDFKELCEFESRNKLQAHLYQQFISPAGEDIRCIVVGGKFLCAMRRSNKKDFRSNVEVGGKGEKFEADGEIKAMCEKVASILDLDYCGIDILTDSNGKRYLCEVNSNAFFAEAEKVCGINIAKKFADLIICDKNA